MALSLSLSLCLSFISCLQCVVQVSLALSLSFIVSFLHVISHHFAIFLSLINIIIIFSSSSFDNVGVVESGVHLIYIKKPDRLTMTRKQQLRKKIAFVFLHFILLFLALLFFAFLLIFFPAHPFRNDAGHGENAIKILFSFVLFDVLYL